MIDCSYPKPEDSIIIILKEAAAYIIREYKFSSDTQWTIKNEDKFTIRKPEKLLECNKKN